MSGSPPCSRHGHVSVAVGTDILIHGGMAGTDMFDDLYKFNTGNAIIVKSTDTYVVLLCEFSDIMNSDELSLVALLCCTPATRADLSPNNLSCL